MSEFRDTGEQFDPRAGEAEPTVLSMAELTLSELHQAIHQLPVDPDIDQMPRVQISGAIGQPNALMRLNHPVQIHVDGPLGDYAFAYCAESDTRMDGSAGHGAAEGMISGTVRIRGDVGVGAGASMQGGTLAVYGSAGDRFGAAMRGGGAFVRGNSGNETGVGALRGTIVIGGDAGERLGDAANNVTIFIRGKAKSLAAGVTEAPLRKPEQLKLGLLLINASIRGEPTDFRRIVPEAVLRAEESQRGEVNPNW
jgi:glutamate synthase domain-containing protein 3